MARIEVPEGARFGRLTVVRELEPRREPAGGRARRFEMLCDCGTARDVNFAALRSGHTASCGCLQREASRAAATTHGHGETPLYHCWQAMKQRTTPGSAQQRRRPNYVGVSRDPRWDAFEEFLKDMGPTYFPGACLGRYGDQGDYTPENCRWQTKSESAAESNQTRKTTTTRSTE